MLSPILIAEHIAVVSAPHRRKKRTRKHSQDYGLAFTIILCLLSLAIIAFAR